jgi:phasin family protein
VASEKPVEVTESKAEVLPAVSAPKPAPEPAKEAIAPAAKVETPAPKPQPAKAVVAKVKKIAAPARKPAAAKIEKKTAPARKAAVARKAQPAKPAKKPRRIVRKAVRTLNKGVKTMANTTRKTVETGQIAAEQFRSAFGDINERAKAAVEKSAKIAEELADLARGNVEAFVASSKVAAKGVESLGQDAAEYSRKSFEDASAAFKSLAEVKSATDFFKLQGDYARSAFDAAVAESARLSETVMKLANDVAEPINSRYTVAAERVKTLAA